MRAIHTPTLAGREHPENINHPCHFTVFYNMVLGNADSFIALEKGSNSDYYLRIKNILKKYAHQHDQHLIDNNISSNNLGETNTAKNMRLYAEDHQLVLSAITEVSIILNEEDNESGMSASCCGLFKKASRSRAAMTYQDIIIRLFDFIVAEQDIHQVCTVVAHQSRIIAELKDQIRQLEKQKKVTPLSGERNALLLSNLASSALPRQGFSSIQASDRETVRLPRYNGTNAERYNLAISDMYRKKEEIEALESRVTQLSDSEDDGNVQGHHYGAIN